MTNTKMLIGSLSNDLYRVATLSQRGSFAAAEKFFIESKKWSNELETEIVKTYIQNILLKLSSVTTESIQTPQQAENLLTYSIILQNYALHLE